MSYGAKTYISTKALKHNLAILRQLVGQRKILAMIKANGYGHGIEKVARALEGADGFGVASVEEALMLRQLGFTTPIVTLSGFYNLNELALLVEKRIDSVIHEFLQIEILEKYFKQGKGADFPLNLWFKIDTGMHRLGFLPPEVEPVYQRLRALLPSTSIKIMTHFADADNADSTYTLKQLELFENLTRDLAGEKSIANSAGILHYPQAHADWVRPGIILYGVSPFAQRTGELEGLQPVMTLTAKLIAIKALQKGDYVGYGCAWKSPEKMSIGVVGIGYGDGYPRHAKNGAPVLVNEVICPLVGRVSMDMIMVDLRGCPQAKIGDTVTLWGKGLPAEKVAAHADTIAYELLCNVTKRVEFIHHD